MTLGVKSMNMSAEPCLSLFSAQPASNGDQSEDDALINEVAQRIAFQMNCFDDKDDQDADDEKTNGKANGANVVSAAGLLKFAERDAATPATHTTPPAVTPVLARSAPSMTATAAPFVPGRWQHSIHGAAQQQQQQRYTPPMDFCGANLTGFTSSLDHTCSLTDATHTPAMNTMMTATTQPSASFQRASTSDATMDRLDASQSLYQVRLDETDWRVNAMPQTQPAMQERGLMMTAMSPHAMAREGHTTGCKTMESWPLPQTQPFTPRNQNNNNNNSTIFIHNNTGEGETAANGKGYASRSVTAQQQAPPQYGGLQSGGPNGLSVPLYDINSHEQAALRARSNAQRLGEANTEPYMQYTYGGSVPASANNSLSATMPELVGVQSQETANVSVGDATRAMRILLTDPGSTTTTTTTPQMGGDHATAAAAVPQQSQANVPPGTTQPRFLLVQSGSESRLYCIPAGLNIATALPQSSQPTAPAMPTMDYSSYNALPHPELPGIALPPSAASTNTSLRYPYPNNNNNNNTASSPRQAYLASPTAQQQQLSSLGMTGMYRHNTGNGAQQGYATMPTAQYMMPTAATTQQQQQHYHENGGRMVLMDGAMSVNGDHLPMSSSAAATSPSMSSATMTATPSSSSSHGRTPQYVIVIPVQPAPGPLPSSPSQAAPSLDSTQHFVSYPSPASSPRPFGASSMSGFQGQPCTIANAAGQQMAIVFPSYNGQPSLASSSSTSLPSALASQYHDAMTPSISFGPNTRRFPQ